MSRAGAAQLIPDQYIVVFKSEVQDVPGLAKRLAAEHGGTLGFTYERAVKGFSARLPARAVEALRRSPNVEYVEQDAVVTTDNDVQSNATWGLDRIDQRPLPIDKTYTYAYTGEGVTAYIFDSGIRFDHEEFEGRAVPGFDAFKDGYNGNDCTGHGTHVAGTVGGRTHGVAKKVRLVSVRVLDCNGTGTWSNVIAAIDWVIQNNRGPAVANMSFGGTLSENLNSAVRTMIGAGIQASMSAGNDDSDACGRSPSSTREAVTVGATGSNDARRSTSNWGSCLDLFAPGSAITSAAHTSSTGTTLKSGTSMAAPHVAGTMALWLQENPSLSPAQLQEMVVSNATPDVVTDAKSANAHLLHSLRAAIATPPNAPPTASFTASCVDLTCSFDASASSDSDGSIARYDWAFGDGSAGSGRTVSRTYAAAGSYTVALTVIDDKGATGISSIIASVTAPSTAPAAPSSLGAKLVSLSQVDLTWTDQSGNETGFEMQRKSGTGEFATLAKLAANTSSFSDTSVLQNQSYTYRVRAYNDAGASVFSNEVPVMVSCTVNRKTGRCK